MNELDNYISELRNLFQSENRRDAHKAAAQVLKRMAEDKSILFQIIERNLTDPKFFENERINPVIAFSVYEDKDITLVAHCFMPRPDQRTDLSHQSIHHHGNLLLSTINCFGNGYESFLFKKGYLIDENEAKMDLQKQYVNEWLHYEFVESNTPHIVFYPPELTITYALWCSEKAQAVDQLKRLSWLRKYKNGLRSLIFTFGLGNLFNLNKVEYLDFYVENKKIIPLKERVRYPVCSNENFIQGLLYILQKVEFPINRFQSIIDHQNLDIIQKELILEGVSKWRRGEPVENKLEEPHLFLEKANLLKKDLLEAIGTN